MSTTKVVSPIKSLDRQRTLSSLAARRPILSEDDLAVPPNKKVLDVVEKMDNDRILASDVAAKAGVSLSIAKKSLSALASLTRGDIAVSPDGDLIYTFPSSVKSVLASNSARYKLTSVWEKQIWPKLFWGIRVSFGVFLFVSIAAIFSTLLFIQTGSSSDSDDRRDNSRGGGGGMGFGYNFGDFLFDIFYPRTFYSPYYGYYGRYDPYYTNRQQMEEEDDDRIGVFEGIFSYIFGDGNPNRNLETARLREAARIIRENKGAVIAEQLAPFCDVPDPDDSQYVDESYVLPVVSQLGGEPIVSEDGDIVYVFPDLQVSTEEERSMESELRMRMERDGIDSLEVLQEIPLEFSRVKGIGAFLAGALGVINLGGALYLGQILSSPALAGVALPSYFGLVQAGYPLLLIYALLFNGIPIARTFYNKKVNAEISTRNSSRRKWLNKLRVGGSAVRRKLSAASSLKRKMRRLGSKDDVYSTKQDFSDLKQTKESDRMKEFDRLLNDDEDTFQ